jgi:hypothetical protein
MANATLRERQTQYKSCPQELYKLNAQQLIKGFLWVFMAIFANNLFFL